MFQVYVCGLWEQRVGMGSEELNPANTKVEATVRSQEIAAGSRSTYHHVSSITPWDHHPTAYLNTSASDHHIYIDLQVSDMVVSIGMSKITLSKWPLKLKFNVIQNLDRRYMKFIDIFVTAHRNENPDFL